MFGIQVACQGKECRLWVLVLMENFIVQNNAGLKSEIFLNKNNFEIMEFLFL